MKKIILSVVIIIGLVTIPLLIPPQEDLLGGIDFSPVVYSSDNKLLRVFLSDDDKYRMWFDITQYPQEFIEALLLKEDKLFYSHSGINTPALFKAFKTTYIDRERRVGASTITMQLVRLKYKLYTKSIFGKIKQIYLALYMDLHFEKQEIIEAFLNLAPCGGNIEGFGSASEYYFSKHPSELTLTEILFLVVLPQNPELRSPKNGIVPHLTLDSRKELFNKWVLNHPEDKKWLSTIDMPVTIIGEFPFLAPHITEHIVENHTRDFNVFNATIDSDYQNLVVDQLNDYIRFNRELGVNNGVALVLDHTTNNLLAAVGSNNYHDDDIQGQVRGFNAKRSPGSTLKPFIYALALEQGIIHPHTMQKDSPQTFGVYTPDNYESNFRGPIFAWEALVQSKNIPAINLANSIKDPDLYDFLKRVEISGLKPKDHYGLSIVLGSAEMSMMELTSLYSILANKGVYNSINILNNDEQKESKKVLSENAAYLTLDALKRNPPAIEYRPIESRDIPIAYKTGTSIGFKDSWAIGIVDKYVIAVWIGNFDGSGNPVFIGRKMAAPLLYSIADTILLLNEHTAQEEIVPENITNIPVCSVSGAIPNDYCPTTIETGFLPGISPITKCKVHREIYIDKRTGFRTDQKDPKYSRKEVREIWSSDLLDLFKQAGLPRLKPPPYLEDVKATIFNDIGSPPQIISPLDTGEYIIRKTYHKHNTLILDTYLDGDSSKVYWFANNIFLGAGKSGSRLEWTPAKIGSYEIIAMDELGRSSSISITIHYSN